MDKRYEDTVLEIITLVNDIEYKTQLRTEHEATVIRLNVDIAVAKDKIEKALVKMTGEEAITTDES